MIFGISQAHRYKVAALTKQRFVYFGWTLTDYNQTDAIFSPLFGDALEYIQRNVVGGICHISLRHIQVSFITKKRNGVAEL
ncbi:hypothetical protein AN928_04090 [Pseudomonas aeruginosa]|nr:hypothetical protein AN929_04935 [Pseudomonas aeruginosa]KZM06981.1 hypothetical protein AN928_04090 [Pseudomonas aeruginosa]KZM13595.1 hypothetical protein AN930_04050 [Pseudomonas aeruginosa]PCK46109.1 hypothetical protein A2J14_17900 [Pseudomonas aeruginosa]PCK56701.1 hypothetical protein A2J11_14560 [Pseudomonas aeruginosa]